MFDTDPTETLKVVTNGVFDCSIFTRLQNLADALVDKFVSKGLMKREYDRVKLHATVMNTKQRDNPDEQAPAKKSRSDVPPRFKKRISFDAKKIITVSHLDFHEMSSIHYMYLLRYKIFVLLAKSDTSWKSRNQTLETEKKQQALRKMWDGVSRNGDLKNVAGILSNRS